MKSALLRLVRHSFAAEPLSEGMSIHWMGETPTSILLIIFISCSAEARLDTARTMKRRHFTVQSGVQAGGRKFDLDDVWKVVLGRQCFTLWESP
jgi:hypothetical protein